jgi:hypothetical protein
MANLLGAVLAPLLFVWSVVPSIQVETLAHRTERALGDKIDVKARQQGSGIDAGTWTNYDECVKAGGQLPDIGYPFENLDLGVQNKDGQGFEAISLSESIDYPPQILLFFTYANGDVGVGDACETLTGWWDPSTSEAKCTKVPLSFCFALIDSSEMSGFSKALAPRQQGFPPSFGDAPKIQFWSDVERCNARNGQPYGGFNTQLVPGVPITDRWGFSAFSLSSELNSDEWLLFSDLEGDDLCGGPLTSIQTYGSGDGPCHEIPASTCVRLGVAIT